MECRLRQAATKMAHPTAITILEKQNYLLRFLTVVIWLLVTVSRSGYDIATSDTSKHLYFDDNHIEKKPTQRRKNDFFQNMILHVLLSNSSFHFYFQPCSSIWVSTKSFLSYFDLLPCSVLEDGIFGFLPLVEMDVILMFLWKVIFGLIFSLMFHVFFSSYNFSNA